MPLLSFLQGLVKDHGSQDDTNAYCNACGVPFSLLVRRHECGLGCGRYFCSKCTLQVFLLSAPRGEPVAARACVPCYKERKRVTPESLGGSRLLQSIDIETEYGGGGGGGGGGDEGGGVPQQQDEVGQSPGVHLPGVQQHDGYAQHMHASPVSPVKRPLLSLGGRSSAALDGLHKVCFFEWLCAVVCVHVCCGMCTCVLWYVGVGVCCGMCTCVLWYVCVGVCCGMCGCVLWYVWVCCLPDRHLPITPSSPITTIILSSYKIIMYVFITIIMHVFLTIIITHVRTAGCFTWSHASVIPKYA